MGDIRYYRVGGWVRDKIIGVKSKDIDYAVEAPSLDAMRDDILARGGKIHVEHPQFFTIRGKMGADDADYVLCRKEGEYSDGRRPDSVEIGTIDDDLSRRDFTMNAIAMRENGTYYDPHNGIQDASIGLIRCVGDTHARFNEDALRMLRAVRFSITRRFTMSSEIRSALNNPHLLAKLSAISLERVRDELNKCFAHNTLDTLACLDNFTALRNVLFSQAKISLEVSLKDR